MKLFLLVFANFIFINKVCSQAIIEIEVGSKSKVTTVDVTGALADRDTAWKQFIIKKLSNSRFKGAKKGKYTAKVNFIVSKDGSISDVKCENDPGYGMCEESVRAIKASGSWKLNKPVQVKVRP